RLSRAIRKRARAWAVAAADAACIDAINILQASRRVMLTAVEALALRPDCLLVDAVELDWTGPQQALIHGDGRSISIAAASIVAKVYRDALLRQWDPVFPAYHLARNKGYGSPSHLAALARWGPTPLHRRSFAPVGGNPQAHFGWPDQHDA
ncbi:MAG: ribonuclease HII, partial [Terriglobales bacterium]